MTEHGYVPGGGGGSGTITYKYWRGITIPPHPGGGEPVVVKTDISEKCRMEIYPDSFEYTGSDITTDVSVILEDSGNLLTKDSDYVLTYVDNRNQGTAKVVASGTGSYTGTLFKTFSITRTLTDIATATITINRDSFVYNGSSQVPTITSVTIGGKTLTVNTDYTVESPTVETTNVGEKYIQIRGVESSGYTGTCSKTYFITKADIRNFEAQAYLEQDEYEFAGTPVVPDVYGLEGLTKNTDYTVTYQNNESVTDNAKAIVTGIGNYEYSFELGFTIVAAPIADYKLLANATVTVGTYTQTYDGSEKNPPITVVDKNGTTLTENVHYTKTVSSNVNAGTGRIVINAVESSGYEGSKETTFQITKANVSYTASGNSCRWDSSASISVSVTYPSAGNYTVYYKSGTGSWSTTNPSFGGSEASVGTHTVYFKIVPTDTDNINSVGTDGSLSKSVTVTSDTLTVSASGAAGTWLDTKSISVSSNPKATITYSTDNSTFGSTNPSYGKGNKSDKGTHTVYYKVQKNGYTTVTGSQTVTLSAVAISSATITLSQTSYDLKGFDAQRSYNDCKPGVTVKTGSTTHTLNSDYTLTYPTGSLAAGGSTTVSVTISGTGAFTESTTKSYSISYNYYPTYYLTGATNPSSIGSVTVSDSG